MGQSGAGNRRKRLGIAWHGGIRWYGSEHDRRHSGRRDPRVSGGLAFLSRDEASYTTGASWVVDDGMLRMGPQAGSHLEKDDWRRS